MIYTIFCIFISRVGSPTVSKNMFLSGYLFIYVLNKYFKYYILFGNIYVPEQCLDFMLIMLSYMYFGCGSVRDYVLQKGCKLFSFF